MWVRKVGQTDNRYTSDDIDDINTTIFIYAFTLDDVSLGSNDSKRRQYTLT